MYFFVNSRRETLGVRSRASQGDRQVGQVGCPCFSWKSRLCRMHLEQTVWSGGKFFVSLLCLRVIELKCRVIDLTGMATCLEHEWGIKDRETDIAAS